MTVRFPKSAVGRLYARLSNTRNTEDISIERQVADGKAWFDANNIKNVVVYVEPKGHRSGTSDKHRPAFRRLMAETQTGDVIWCNDQARFVREEDVITTFQNLHKRGVVVVFHGEIVDVTNVSGRMTVRTRGFVNRMYAEMVSESQTKAYADFKAAGAYINRKNPPGLRGDGKGLSRRKMVSQEGVFWIGGQIVVGERDAPPTDGEYVFHSYFDTVVAFLQVYTEKEMGTPSAAAYLQEQGYCVRQNSGVPRRVRHYDLGRILSFLHHYEGLVPDRLLAETQRQKALNSLKNRGGRSTTHEIVLLRRMLYCHHCGARYFTTYDYGKYPCYRHHYRECQFSRKWSANKVNRWFWETLRGQLNLSSEDVEKRAGMLPEDDTWSRRSEIRSLEDKLSRLEESRIDGTIRRETYNAKYVAIQDKLEELRNKPKSEPVIPIQQRVALVRSAIETLELADTLEPGSARDVIRQVVDRVTLDAEGVVRIVPRKGMEPFFVKS